MGLSQAPGWKAVSDKEISSLEKHGVFNLVPITSVPEGHTIVGTSWVFKTKAYSTYKGRLVVQEVSRILGINITRDRDRRTITISQKDNTEDIVQCYGMKDCNPAYTPGIGPKLSLNQLEKQRYQVTRYGILYVVNQLARVISTPVKTTMGAAQDLLRYLALSTDFFITYKQGGFRLASFSDANWGNNLDNGRPTSAYIVTLTNAQIIFKVGLQGLIAQSTMEAEIVVAFLRMDEAAFCSNMRLELGFDGSFGSVLLYIDSTSALHVAGNRTHTPYAKQTALRYCLCKNSWKRARSVSTTSRARISLQT